MLSLALIIYFTSSLLVTTFAVPTGYIPTVSVPKDIELSAFSSLSLPIAFLVSNITTTEAVLPQCWPDNPEHTKDASPITHPADCFQAVLKMLSEGSDLDLRVWDGQRAWTYGSCGLFLVTSPRLPIHRDTFSRNDVAQCAESIRQACVDEAHGYRGGILPIAAGVFQVAVSGKPT